MASQSRSSAADLSAENSSRAVQPSAGSPTILHSSRSKGIEKPITLFQTAVVSAYGPKGSVTFRCVFDSGSDLSYASSRLLTHLGVPAVSEKSFSVNTFGGNILPSSLRKMFVLSLCKAGPSPTEHFEIEVVETPQICRQLHPPSFDVAQFPHLQGIALADAYPSGCTPSDPSSIDLLIGLDHLPHLMKPKIIQGSQGDPVAQETVFGYVVFGSVTPSATPLQNRPPSTCLFVSSEPSDVSFDLANFWSIESMGIDPPQKKDSDDEVLQGFNQSITFNGQRYEVKLPWKSNAPPLQDNFRAAHKRLRSLDYKLSKSSDLQVQYNSVLQEFDDLGFVEDVPPSQFTTSKVFYLPHRPVVRLDKLSTKVRPVFDGSAVSPSGYSLNDCLHTGPRIGSDIFDILLRFRFEKYVFAADIQKAFLMIQLHPDDRDVCRFLVHDEMRLLITKRFTRVCFGLVCSPFLLAATIEHHFDQQIPSDFVETLRRDRYVDDFICGEDSVEKVFQLAEEGRRILKGAGMTLRQFQSSSPELKELFKQHDFHVQSSDSETFTKVLGIIWILEEDCISIPSIADLSCPCPLTKRMMLSLVSKVYDPLGLASPLVISAKLMIQVLWQSGVGWDDPLSAELEKRCKESLKHLKDLQNLSFPRRIASSSDDLSLHLFCDGSPEAYCCTIYLRSSESCNLYTSKSRVAPISKLELPRLETMACVIGSRLLARVRAQVPSLASIPTFAYTDSTITLGWISSPPRSEVFIHNRIRQITSLLPDVPWFHVDGEYNPADLGTRSSSAKSFKKNPELWFHGPPWLQENSQFWPSNGVLPAVTLISHTSSPDPATENIFHPEKFSSLQRLLRVTGTVLKYLSALRVRSYGAPLSSDFPQKDALNVLIRQTQSCSFSEELSLLRQGLYIPNSSRISALNPSIGPDGLLYSVGRTIRVEGDQGLIILPGNDPFTDLIISSCHAENFHCGVDITLASLRSTFWILKGRQNVKRVLHSCRVCRKHHSTPYQSPESALPSIRITPARPFSRVGVDYFGHFNSKDKGKCWGLLVTCCVSRALFLELVPDMTSTTLLNVILRLEARYGSIEVVISDNAKSFKKVAEFLSFRMSWRFIPDRSPHWGGFYERLVKSTKSCLKKVVGRHFLSFDDLRTTLVRIEGVLNRRPLTYVSEDPMAPQPLRPIDLLKPISAFGDRFDASKPVASEYQQSHRRSQVILNSFWNAWQKEYLVLLRRWRQDPSKKARVPEPGHVVQLQATNTKNRSFFPLGVITSLIHGTDGKVRAAWIRTSRGTLRRGIHLLYPLEFEDDPATSPDVEEHVSVPEPSPCAVEKISFPASSTADAPVLERVSRSGRRIKPPQRY
jgi:hypothetical protein